MINSNFVTAVSSEFRFGGTTGISSVIVKDYTVSSPLFNPGPLSLLLKIDNDYLSMKFLSPKYDDYTYKISFFKSLGGNRNVIITNIKSAISNKTTYYYTGNFSDKFIIFFKLPENQGS